MDACDVLIVGGGPAGSSCAWALKNSGLDVRILDKAVFPRDKVCGGWITPPVLTALAIDPSDYALNRILQPITGFRLSLIGGPAHFFDYGVPVSFGIRRCEFDHYLLRRCGARVYEGAALSRLERMDGGWIVNGDLGARLIVGAGGHFCPVARLLCERLPESPVVAQETEFEMDPAETQTCTVAKSVPELYFCSDLKGYGWCFRKANVLNIGMGRADTHRLSEHVKDFLQRLHPIAGSIRPLRGHAYFLRGSSPRCPFGDGFLLIGDSAGLARPQSGEGILPAIQSGLLAADVIRAADGDYAPHRLQRYADRLPHGNAGILTRIGRHLPPALVTASSALLMNNPWFLRHQVLDRWFLRA
ncbi:MAG: NAD(P)/FAD-dependent oxidoreductase [Acidobacteriota bacterium]|nr:NAD(P)/FAD-dependent oxidoreductase [Acidobacteriota bacterium]